MRIGITARTSRIAVLLVFLGALSLGAMPAAATAPPHVSVYFLRGEQLAKVLRPGRTPLDAMRQLVAGPTPAELGQGFRTYLPANTRVFSVKVANGVATVDLNERFASGSDGASLLARLSQVVRTLTGPQGAKKVQLLINSGTVAARFPGMSLSGPISFRFLQTPNVPVPEPPGLRLPPPDAAVKAVQQQLIELGYLLPGDGDGRFGPATQNAILSFQKWERLGRTGLLDGQTKARLAVATHPSPISKGAAGKRAEVLLDRQVALLIEDNQVVRTIAVSTGKPSTPTPPGDYRVYAKIPRWWSTPFREWLPWALPFVGGIAFHELQDVPAYPASHGCVRQSFTVARWTYDFASIGMPVKVIAKS
jgi:L,D-transpeptidase-like protein/sporulation and spore germination protein/putative peptidoglycan binding protein